jgi:hypothetical protein
MLDRLEALLSPFVRIIESLCEKLEGLLDKWWNKK